MILRPGFPTTHDMILAYRKVKAEIWWMKTVPSLRALSDYEANLEDNLKALRKRIRDPEFTPDRAFLGGVFELPKKIVPQDDHKKDPIHFRQVSDDDSCLRNQEAEWKDVEIRIMATPSIDFQILGVLWTMAEGGRHDAKRSSACRANVLRRDYLPEDDTEVPVEDRVARGPINKRYPGVFKPYFTAYKKWRDDGLKKAKTAVENGERVFALTLDLRRYFHQIDARCLGTLYPSKSPITRSFYKSLEVWQKLYGEVPDGEGFREAKLGIPVGLIASGLVANLILHPLDKAIQERLSPIYYGRYVDDFFLVFTLNGEFPTGESVLMELVRIMRGKDKTEPRMEWHKPGTPKGGEEGLLEFRFPQWKRSQLVCKAAKQRLFLLEGKPGRDLITVIDQELKEHSSEWRMVPELSEDDDRWLKEALVASHDAVEGATSLRRADDLSIRRMGVAVALRKLEATERFGLKLREWKHLRESFYRIAITHICTPDGLCDFWPNLPRLFGLLFANNDWSHASKILTKIVQARDSFITVSGKGDILGPWFCEVVSDEILRSCPKKPTSPNAKRFLLIFKNAFTCDLFDADSIRDKITEFRIKDLDRKGIRVRSRMFRSLKNRTIFRNSIQSLQEFLDSRGNEIPIAKAGLLFPTRPMGELEVCLNRPRAAEDSDIMHNCLYALRGQAKSGRRRIRKRKSKNDGPPLVRMNPEFPGNLVRAAITSYRTEESSWTSRVRGKPDLSIDRLHRLLKIVDDFLRQLHEYPWREKPLYFCLPELSVPPEWIHLVAYFFSQAGVSLIAGVEYEKAGKNNFFNSAYLYLRNKNLGYPTTYVLRQKKTLPAPGEAQELWKEGKHKLVGPTPDQLPVYIHGGFRFGVLICSELTDSEIHQHFRGHVDAIICLEWNKDTETFSALVEGSAQTIHAFIVQVNNRLFGDSRIRAPAKKRHNRDVVRLNGGDHDYWVVGTLPISELRDFQSCAHSNLSPDAPYKPLPSGYDPSKYSRLKRKRTK